MRGPATGPGAGADAHDQEQASRDLTRRERTVLRLLVDGRRNLEISEELGISERTVKFHVRGLFTKLGVSSRTQVVSHALKHGLI